MAAPGQDQDCPDGTYSLGNASSCEPCPRGYECPRLSGEAVSCVAGKYQHKYGQTSCDDCPTGYYQPQSGSYYCLLCPAGFKCEVQGDRANDTPEECPEGTYSYPGSLTCDACDPGYICPKRSDTPRPPGFECPIGYYCETDTTFGYSATSMQPCAAGTYNPVIMGVDTNACLPCEPGYFCEEGTGDYTLFPCLPHNYCPASTTAPAEFPCPAGTYNPSFGALRESECIPCPEGHACAGGVAPTTCTTGGICPVGTGTMLNCYAGTFNPTEGRHRNEDCLPCPTGYFCIEQTTTPEACPQGTYNPILGAPGDWNCLPCPPGFACPYIAMSQADVTCKTGYYCPQGTIYQNQFPCPAGTYSDSPEIYTRDQCLQCPPGYFCPIATTSVTRLKCTGGHYCPEGTMDGQQYPCPPGTHIPDAEHNFSEITFCIPCPRGKACELGTQTPADCEPGYYCPAQTEFAKQYPCPAGTFQTATDLERPDQCTACGQGKYCLEGAIAELNCPDGTYNPKYRAIGKGPGAYPACQQCPGGSICNDVNGTTDPVACANGKFSYDQATSCGIC